MMQSAEIVDTFIHIADLHFWHVETNPLRMLNKRFLGNINVITRRRREFILERAEPLADAVAARDVKDVLITGDLSSTSTDTEFEMASKFVHGLRGRGLRVCLMPGNHDVYTFGSVRKKRFERHFGEFMPGKHYDLPGGTRILIVPTVCPRPLTARGFVSAEAIEEVAESLKECGPHVVVAAHYPVLNETRGYHSNRSRRLQNGDALRDALGASGKRILYVAGHVHRFSYERDPGHTGIEHLTTSALFRTHGGSEGEFSEVRVLPESFEVVRYSFREGAAEPRKYEGPEV